LITKIVRPIRAEFLAIYTIELISFVESFGMTNLLVLRAEDCSFNPSVDSGVEQVSFFKTLFSHSFLMSLAANTNDFIVGALI
jgi:hypothetical protein